MTCSVEEDNKKLRQTVKDRNRTIEDLRAEIRQLLTDKITNPPEQEKS